MKKAFSKKNLWEETHYLVRATVGRFLGALPLEFLLGKKFRTNCAFAQNAQLWSDEKRIDYQLNKLREITLLAYENTKYYHKLFDEAGFDPESLNSLEDIKRIPPIDRQNVTENINEMFTRPITGRDIDFASTGGVSGMPLNFYINADRSETEYAYLITSWQRAGYKLGMPLAVLRGRIIKPDRNGLYHEYDPIFHHHYYSAFHLSDENIARYLKHIAHIGECFLHVYPSSASALARFIIRNGSRAPANIRGIISESEIVYPQQRKMIEEVFGCRLFSCYGQSEKVVLAAGCEKSDNYHIWPTYGYFELLDEQGNTVSTPGQRGEIIGTGFINTVMPFIRYKTGDWATYVGDCCPECGRKHIIIQNIIGHRTQEVLIAADGSEVSWTALNMHDDTFLNVRQFQFMQEKPGYAILHVVPSNGFSEKDIIKIKNRLRAKLNNSILINIEKVKSIPLSTRGKAVYIDQRIPKEMK